MMCDVLRAVVVCLGCMALADLVAAGVLIQILMVNYGCYDLFS